MAETRRKFDRDFKEGAVRLNGEPEWILCRRRHKFRKIANVVGALPKSAHPGAKKALAEIWNAEDKEHARKAVKAFAAAYGAKFPRPPPRSPGMRRNCWRSMTTRPSTGCTCALPTRS